MFDSRRVSKKKEKSGKRTELSNSKQTHPSLMKATIAFSGLFLSLHVCHVNSRLTENTDKFVLRVTKNITLI